MRRYTVIFAPRAKRQLESLYAYIATHGGEQRADNYVSRIVTECLSLATFPERGTSATTCGRISASWVSPGA
jgi:toxin ParE1/3/4